MVWRVVHACEMQPRCLHAKGEAGSQMSVATSELRSCLLAPEFFTSFTLGVSVTMVGTGLAATATTTSLTRRVLHLLAKAGITGRPARAPADCKLREVCEQTLRCPCARAQTMALPSCGLCQVLAADSPAGGQELGPAGWCSSIVLTVSML